MKKSQIILILGMLIAVTGFFASCTKNDSLPNNGKPWIKYVRVTNPLSADSLLVGAHQGNLIAIVGENLETAQQLWFNDQPATLTPTYVTSSSILVSVPNPIPKEVNNKIKIFFSGGDSLLYDFVVQISKPALNNMLSEYVNAGDVATIRGDFFYEPLKVTFTGGVTGEVVSLTDKAIQVKIPEGVQPGPVTVTTNFGETESDFWFRDNRNIFISSDPFEGWWNASYVIKPADVHAGDPLSINGNYIRVKKTLGAWSYNEIAGGPADAMPLQSKNIPGAAILKPADYYLKFEINTMKPYNNSMIVINAGLIEQNFNGYKWAPPYDSKGQWNTVVIPFEEVAASYGTDLKVNPSGYWTRILMQGAGDLDADVSFDNFRVVPKYKK